MKVQTIFPSFTLCLVIILISMDYSEKAMVQAKEAADQPIFELPVQLVGFPVIVLAVRFTNFVKKLAYSVNPSTYKARVRRSSAYYPSEEDVPPSVDPDMAEKKILEEYGPKACVIEEPCKAHALRPGQMGAQPDWNDILSNYKVQRSGMKQWYLLSVFLGDIIRDPALCKRLAKRIPCSREIIKAHQHIKIH